MRRRIRAATLNAILMAFRSAHSIRKPEIEIRKEAKPVTEMLPAIFASAPFAWRVSHTVTHLLPRIVCHAFWCCASWTLHNCRGSDQIPGQPDRGTTGARNSPSPITRDEHTLLRRQSGHPPPLPARRVGGPGLSRPAVQLQSGLQRALRRARRHPLRRAVQGLRRHLALGRIRLTCLHRSGRAGRQSLRRAASLPQISRR